jgi:predicted PurR-regulated permease PerM
VPHADPVRDILEPSAATEHVAEEVEILQTSLKIATVAQVVIATVAIIGLIYLLKLVLVTTLASMLVAYALEPLVRGLGFLKVPRWLGSLIVVLLAMALAGALTYVSYSRAIDFADELPHYSSGLRDTLSSIRERVSEIENQARSVVEPPRTGKQPIPVKIQEPPGFARMISENSGTILDIMLAIGFVPFLVYFMLATKDHSHVATVRLFPKGHRMVAHRTVGTISAMIRSYIGANILVGALNGLICIAIFWFLGIKYFYFVGAICGFVGLIPYLGIFLALLAPLAAGIDALNKTGIMTVVVSIVVLHIITMNVIYPKVIGSRLSLNPLAVSLSLLFWAWIWGAPGLILAVPLLGAAKIICDHVEPLRGLGSWLGESLDTRATNLHGYSGN